MLLPGEGNRGRCVIYIIDAKVLRQTRNTP
jgi:hypothetical protein